MTNGKKKDKINLRKDVWISLTYYLHEQGEKVSGVPGVKISRTAIVNEVLMNFLASKGHYPPKIQDTVKTEERNQ
jgi:hypothetical protein